ALIAPPRILKVLWLLRPEHTKFIPRTPEVIAKLLVRHVDTDLAALRAEVEKTLLGLQSAGYVARDEATAEYKYLNERERTIEQERFTKDTAKATQDALAEKRKELGDLE